MLVCWPRQNNARLEDFDRKKTLGTGAFGRVILVKHKQNEQFYALKLLDKHQVDVCRLLYFGRLDKCRNNA